jgi:hypothetical protein
MAEFCKPQLVISDGVDRDAQACPRTCPPKAGDNDTRVQRNDEEGAYSAAMRNAPVGFFEARTSSE